MYRDFPTWSRLSVDFQYFGSKGAIVRSVPGSSQLWKMEFQRAAEANQAADIQTIGDESKEIT
jgi:hypothetical protein